MILLLFLTTLALSATEGEYWWDQQSSEIGPLHTNTFVYMSYLYVVPLNLSKCWVYSHIPTFGNEGGISFVPFVDPGNDRMDIESEWNPGQDKESDS